MVCTVATSIAAEWYQVSADIHPVTIEASGVVESKHTLRFTPPPSFFWNLTISEIVQEGKRVEAGELLVRFEGTQENYRLTQNRQQLTVKRGELASVIEQQAQEIETEKLRLAEAESIAEKANRKATQPVDLIPSVEYEKLVEQRELAGKVVEKLTFRARASARARESRRRAIEVAIQRLERQVASLQSSVSAMTILAPEAGVTVIGTNFNMLKYDVGSMTQPSDVIVELVDDTQLEVRGDVREKYASRLAIGQKVRMEAESTGGLEMTGEIVALGNSVRRKSRQSLAMVRDFTVELDQRSANVKLGVAVQVFIEVNRRENTIALPIDAIHYRNGLPGVITRTGWRNVRVGERSNGKIIVVDGLSEDDVVEI